MVFIFLSAIVFPATSKTSPIYLPPMFSKVDGRWSVERCAPRNASCPIVFKPSLRVMRVRALQPENAFASIFSMVSDSTTFTSDLQFWKALSGIVVMPSPSVIFSTAVLLKELLPISVTLLRFMDVSPVQPEKASSPMMVRVFGSTTSFISVFPLKAPASMPFTVVPPISSGISSFDISLPRKPFIMPSSVTVKSLSPSSLTTFTLHTAVSPPALAVISAVPGSTPVTSPLSVTFTIFLSLLLHTTTGIRAPSGEAVTVSVFVSCLPILRSFSPKVMDVASLNSSRVWNTILHLSPLDSFSFFTNVSVFEPDGA